MTTLGNSSNSRFLSSNRDNVLAGERVSPILPASLKSSGIGILRMPSYIEDTDSDLIHEEVKKLSGANVGFTDRSVSSSSKYSSCEILSNISPAKRFNKKEHVSPFIKSVLENISPKHYKKMKQKPKDLRGYSPHPVWPNSMSTYSRGVSVYASHPIIPLADDSLSSLRAQVRLEEHRKIRNGFHNMIAQTDNFSEIDQRFVEDSEKENVLDNVSDDLIALEIEKMNNKESCLNHINEWNSKAPTEVGSSSNYHGQSPFDDNFDPLVHKFNVREHDHSVFCSRNAFKNTSPAMDYSTISDPHWPTQSTTQTKPCPEIANEMNVKSNSEYQSYGYFCDTLFLEGREHLESIFV